MRALRHWSARHAVGLKRVYDMTVAMTVPLRPLMRILGRDRFDRLARPVERVGKELFFDCKMCGQCALSSTGMSCPTNCAKTMRNGPCGGVRSNGMCEVDPEMRCVWVEAYKGREKLAKAGISSQTTLAPIDYREFGKSTWARVVAKEPELEKEILETEGAVPTFDSETHPFAAACQSDRFLTTVEIAPPDTVDPAPLLKRAAHFTGLVDAMNITDGAGGNCHMSSVAAATLLMREGHEAVCQFSCRDRNRIALQGDLLGAATMGIRNVVCLTGDDVSCGDHPMAKPVFDLDSVSLLRIARHMRDDGQMASGRKLGKNPDFFIGATSNPFVPPYDDRIVNLEAKVDAGAQFIQTQFCFDLPLLERFMERVRERGLHRRCAIIIGVGTLNTAKALGRMREMVPGVHIPDQILARIAQAEDQKAEGKRILIETMQALANIEGVSGTHVMGYRNESVLADAIRESGIRSVKRHR